jgi:hypothetical protein
MLWLRQFCLPGPAAVLTQLHKLKKPSSDAVDDGLLLISWLLNHPPLSSL